MNKFYLWKPVDLVDARTSKQWEEDNPYHWSWDLLSFRFKLLNRRVTIHPFAWRFPFEILYYIYQPTTSKIKYSVTCYEFLCFTTTKETSKTDGEI